MFARMWLMVLIAVGVSVAGTADQTTGVDSTVPKTDTILPADTDSPVPGDVIIASYFHGDVRCATCMKLEAYSSEAILTGFKTEVKDSLLVFRAVNWDREENAHYIDDYQLYTKALILSRMHGKEERVWVNLDSIWQYVGDKDKFIKYVQAQTRAFIDPPTNP